MSTSLSVNTDLLLLVGAETMQVNGYCMSTSLSVNTDLLLLVGAETMQVNGCCMFGFMIRNDKYFKLMSVKLVSYSVFLIR